MFTATVAELQAAVAAVLPAVPGRPSYPALGHILVTVTDDRATLRGTDLQVGVERSLRVRNATPGAVLIPAKLSADVLGALPPDADVTMEHADTHVILRAQRNVTRVAAISAEEYPEFPTGDVALGTVPGAALLDLINSVAYAAAGDNSRPVLAAISIVSTNGTITTTAADGFRLARRRIAADAEPFALLLNGVMVKPLRQLCRADESVQLYTNKLRRHLVMRGSDWSLIGSIVDGTYPEVVRIIPKDAAHVATFTDNRDLLRTLGLMSLTAENSMIKLSFAADGIELASRDSTNSSSANVGARVGGAALPGVGLNTRYVRDAIQAIGVPVSFNINSAQSPMVIVPAAADAQNLHGCDNIHLVMPMSTRA